MEINLKKRQFKSFVALLMAFLIAMSTMWTGLSVVTFAVDSAGRSVTAGNVTNGNVTSGNMTDGNIVESGYCGKNVKYELYRDGTLIIFGTGPMYDYEFFNDSPFYDSYVKTIVISDGVTTIGGSAFEFCTSLTSVTIPDSVTTIGRDAFAWCRSLTEVTIGDSVTTIGDYAFYFCDNLTSVTVNENNQNYSSDEYGVLFNKDKTTLIKYPLGNRRTAYTIPDGVTTIDDYAFAVNNMYGDDKSRLTSVTIPDSVTTIGDYAFQNCTSLTSITIPDSVITIGDSAFRYCDSLMSVIIGSSVTTIGDDAFDDCYSLTGITVDENNQNYSSDEYGVLFNKDETTLIQYPIGNKRTAYTIPDGVTTIGYEAFSLSINLTSITIPDSVTAIGLRAFYDTGYYKIASNWENNVLYIGKYLIEANDSLSGSYTIKDGTKVIAERAFVYCDSLTSVTIPDSVIIIGADAFSGSGLSGSSLTSVTIGNSVTTIGNSAFSSCDSLTKVTIPDSVTTIGDSAFRNCESLTEVTIPDSVTTIGDWAFAWCDSLTSITIPDSVTTIGGSAFEYCSNLTSITIPDSVTTIGDHAFDDCDNLTSVTIPDSVTTIGNQAFYHCDSLTEVTIGNSVTSIGGSAFCHCDSLTDITVDENNQYFSNDEYGVLFNKDKTTLIQYPIGNERTAYTIPDSVTTIGDSAFYWCDSLTDVYYVGTQEQWKKISIGSGNSDLTGANIHYNYCVHANKESKPQQNATCTEIGYTAGAYCPDCEKWVEGHSIISATGHTFTEKIIDDKHLKSNATVEEAAIYKYDCAACDVISSDKTFTHGKALTLGITGKITVTQTTSSITLTWDKAENATGYRIYYKLPGDLSWRQCISYTTATSYTFNNLPAGQSYRFAVRSAYVKADGGRIYGGYKEIATATKAVAPSKITSAQNTTAIRLTWSKCPGATGYRIYYKSGNTWKICLNATTATSHTFTGLKAGSKFTFAVRPYIITDSGVVWSDYTTYTASTLPAIPKTAVTSPSSGKITVKWNAVSGAEAYQLYYKTGNGAYKLYKNYFSAQTVNFSGLKSGTKYTFAVRAAKNTSGGWVFGSFTPVSVTVK